MLFDGEPRPPPKIIDSCFISVQIHMKDAESAESKEKSNFRFFQFLFFEFWSFLYPNFRWIFHNDSKNKNWKKKISFYSAHCTSSKKMGSNLRREGGVCISLAGKWPIYIRNLIVEAFLRPCAHLDENIVLVRTWLEMGIIEQIYINYCENL